MKMQKAFRMILSGLLALLITVLPLGAGSESDVRILFINVGKADAILITDGARHYLVDSGEKASAPRLIGALNVMGVTALNGVFLTHTHSDHIGGMDALARNFQIGTLYSAEITELTKKGKNKFEEMAAELSLDLRKLTAREAIELSNSIHAEIIGPLVPSQDDDNDNSLVLRITANGKTLLLTGDMQFAEEATLLQNGLTVSADVIKVGNHGNPDATSNQFARAVSPQIAVITTDTSVDADSANSRVLSALSGSQIYITEDFPIGVLLDIQPGGEIKVSDPYVSHESSGLKIAELDKSAQTVTLINEGSRMDISGYMIFSEKGGELYIFPEGTMMDQGQPVRLAAGSKNGDFIWTGEDKPWNQKKSDTAILYDRYGREVSRIEN